MTLEIILLALASTVRPTSLAAVYAILAVESPRRLMIAYNVAGLTFTIAIGLLVIWAFNGIDLNTRGNRGEGIAEIVGGLLALGFGLAILSGRIGGPHPDDAPDAPSRWARIRELRITLRTAALAGPATHVPGLFYLLALNVIVSHEVGITTGLFEVLIYNAIWFAIPLGALAVCIVEPAVARRAVGAIDTWAREHARTIMLVVAFGSAAVLIVRGALAL